MHRLQKLSRTFPTFAFSLHLHIVFFQHTQYVRLPIQRFARQRNERDNPLRPVVLQSAGSDMQYPAHVFPVRYTSPFIAGRKFAVTLSTYFILRSRASKYACTSSMSFVITSILFFLYQFLRFGFRPGKIFYLASIAFRDTYNEEVIKKWLTTFCRRFFQQQFKRSCLPDGPKVGSVSLSPRGDWRMPSDASAAMWLKECEEL